jgi:DNA polymerase-1
LLRKGGVTVLKGEGYEADDLVKAAVDRAKVDYPDLPIHVVTGDADLVPLVDEQVSVFLTSRKTTYAECKAWEKNHYVQITPKNYQEILEDLSSYRTIKVPYNTLLLAKCLRGDKSDDIAGYPKFTPTKYNALMQSLIDDGYDLSELCRYDEPTTTICYRDTEKPIPLDLISSTPNENKMIIYGEPKKCTELCKVLSNYLDEDIVEHVRFVYNGINLNCAFTNLPDVFKRRPAKLSNQIMGYSAAELQKAVSVVQINLPMI